MAHRNFSATSARQIRQCCRVYQTIDVVERRGFSEWVASDWAIRTDHGWVKHKPLRSWWNFYYTCDSPRLSESPSRLRPNRICIDNPSFAILSLQTLLFCAVSIDDLFWCVHDYSFHWSIRISISWHLFPDRPTQNLKREKRQAIYTNLHVAMNRWRAYKSQCCQPAAILSRKAVYEIRGWVELRRLYVKK